MRTTITLADDVALAVDELRRGAGRGISEIVNDLLRRGLAHEQPRESFRQRTSDMGSPQLALDDLSGLLDTLDGDDRRS